MKICIGSEGVDRTSKYINSNWPFLSGKAAKCRFSAHDDRKSRAPDRWFVNRGIPLTANNLIDCLISFRLFVVIGSTFWHHAPGSQHTSNINIIYLLTFEFGFLRISLSFGKILTLLFIFQ